MSISTGVVSWSSGTVGALPSCPVRAGELGVPGSHWTNFSPISASARMMQRALVLNGAKPCCTSISTRALRCGVRTMSLTVPTGAPATFTCWPGIRAAVRSKTASTR